MKPIIVGIDPGSTSAVAAVDFEGELVLLESGKNFPPRDIIQQLLETGKPVVVASDKGKTPSTVEKIASSLGAEIYEPDNDLGSSRKQELGDGDNSHEVDASASALNAYNHLQRELRKIEELSDQLEQEKKTVASKYFSDGPVRKQRDEDNTQEKQETRRNAESSSDPEDNDNRRFRKKIENLEKRVEELEDENRKLEERNSELQSQVDKLREGKRDEIIREREISKKQGKIKEKAREIDELERKLRKSKVREKQYRRAMKKIREGAELIPIVEEVSDDIPENILTRSNELKQKLESRGINAYLVDEIKGVEMNDYVAVVEFPDRDDFSNIVKEYRDSR